MDEEKPPKSPFANKLWEYRIEFFSGFLLLIGIILSFFYVHIGGALVGLAVGFCFFEEIHSFFVQLRDFFTTTGLFKTIMVVGLVLYLLISVPIFIIAVAVGYGVMFFINWLLKK